MLNNTWGAYHPQARNCLLENVQHVVSQQEWKCLCVFTHDLFCHHTPGFLSLSVIQKQSSRDIAKAKKNSYPTGSAFFGITGVLKSLFFPSKQSYKAFPTRWASMPKWQISSQHEGFQLSDSVHSCKCAINWAPIQKAN